MPTVNHFPNLVRAFQEEWRNRPAVLNPFNLRNDSNRYWSVETPEWRKVSTWECRPFPGCSALITTTQFQVYDGYKEQGIGRALRELQHKAYKRAGFNGEIATVRTDNDIMNGFMSGRVIDEFPSDFGGTFKVWLTKFNEPVTRAAPPPPPRTPFTYTQTPPNPPMRVTVPVETTPQKVDWLTKVREQYK